LIKHINLNDISGLFHVYIGINPDGSVARGVHLDG